MNGCPCFWVVATARGEHWLWASEGEQGSCPASPWGDHHGRVKIGEAPLVEGKSGGYVGTFDPPAVGWPTKCAFCDFVFTGSARRSVNVDRIYVSVDGRPWTLRGPNGEGGSGPPGMMFHQDWMSGRWTDRFGDGINLTAVCPDGTVWNVDGPAYNHGVQTPNAWSRTGDPRVPGSVSVTPSIDCGASYHGWLTAGSFTAG